MTDVLTSVADQTLAERYFATRALTESLASPLSAEDQTVQSMPDVSPTKWHRAHTTWFFETFLLEPRQPGYQLFHPEYGFLFNSYYEGVGARYPRTDRGLISRPGIADIARYRVHVDEAMADLLQPDHHDRVTGGLVELGIQHEQQHQELLLMDIKHVLSLNPLQPAYDRIETAPGGVAGPAGWTRHSEGTYDVGYQGGGFSFDNESPRHRVYLGGFSLADRLITCGEWTEFIDDGGYRRPELWLSDGWGTTMDQGWESPLYWSKGDGGWEEFTLGGPIPVDPAQPVCHVSYYEADAFARWAGYRLPTETEWEVATAAEPVEGYFLDRTRLHPSPVVDSPEGVPPRNGPFGNVWQWTSSAYSPYPGFEAAPGAVGEYNGKFMVSQYVLRGGSCVTPPGHVRTSYRNFFPPSARWAFSGVRLARNY
jgi:ergothioneine biosynthesis protein EgtB